MHSIWGCQCCFCRPVGAPQYHCCCKRRQKENVSSCSSTNIKKILLCGLKEMDAHRTCSAQICWPSASAVSGSTSPEIERIGTEHPRLPRQKQLQQRKTMNLQKQCELFQPLSFNLIYFVLYLSLLEHLTLFFVYFTLAGWFLSSPVAMMTTGYQLMSI